MRNMKLISIVICCLILQLVLVQHSSSQDTGKSAVVKISNVDYWVMQKFLDRGKSFFSTKDDSFPGLKEALEKGIVDSTVGWGNKQKISADTLFEKSIKIAPLEVLKAYGGTPDLKVNVSRPRDPSGWYILTIPQPGSSPAVVLVLEIGGEYRSYSQALDSIAVKTPDGKLMRFTPIPFVLRDYFSYISRRNTFGTWLKSKSSENYGISLIASKIDFKIYEDSWSQKVITIEDTNQSDTLYIRIPLSEKEFGGNYVPEIVLGWKNRIQVEVPLLEDSK